LADLSGTYVELMPGQEVARRRRRASRCERNAVGPDDDYFRIRRIFLVARLAMSGGQ
jgi:hypothetical protein